MPETRYARVIKFFFSIALAVIAIPVAVASASPQIAPQSVSVETADGRLICNTSGAFSQIPGRPDFFIGRGFGIGTIEYCHTGLHNPVGFLALYKMDWQHHVLVMQNYLLKPPLRTSSGIDLHSVYDPYVTSYKGQLWVAFECTVPGVVSTCVGPLASDLQHIDSSRISVAAEGIVGPQGPNKQIVTLVSASAPTILSYGGNIFLYWQVDYFHNDLPENVLVTRAIQLQQDGRGLLWGVNSGGRPVQTNDPRLTSLVHDVNRGDATKNHVAITSDLIVVGKHILEISSTGGTAGQQICRSTHDNSPGCFIVSISAVEIPLGNNIFGQNLITNIDLPANGVEYPRLIANPAGQYFLFGYFFQPKAPPLAAGRKMYSANGLEYIPIDLTAFLH